MHSSKSLAGLLLLASLSPVAHGYSYITASCGVLDYNSGHMTFNYTNSLSTAEKNVLDVAFQRTTEFSDTSITAIDNGDSSYATGNNENEIYHDVSVGTAQCYSSFNVANCLVGEADIRFGDQPWVTATDSQVWPFLWSAPGGRSILATGVHEAGHCLGMGHENTLYNMMGSDWNHVTRNGVSTYHGPGEDLSNGLIDLHGERSGGSNTYRDVGATVFRYEGASGAYSDHKWGVMRNTSGSVLPVIGFFSGQSQYAVDPGQQVQLEFTLENNGEMDSETPNVGYYLSSNSNISSSDTLILATSTTLTRNTPNEITQTLTIPLATVPGDYFLGVYVDHDDLISEVTGLNNVAYYPIRISAPDLITESPGVSATSLSPGQAYTANATVRNQGNQSSGSSTLRYYQSADATISTADTQLTTDFVSGLLPDGTSFESAPVNAPVTPGTYWIGACVDTVSGETVTTNQCSGGVQIAVGGTAPTATTLAATEITDSQARLNATVNPNGQATTVYFDYLRDGETVPVTLNAGSIGAGTSPVNVSLLATGLVCETGHLFAVRAVSAGGTTVGNPGLFATLTCPGC
ncbi:MAG: hypothetical protein Hals2KO_38450 [Halioglobus sp.]